VSFPYEPGESFIASVIYVYPVLDPMTRTIKVRLAAKNPNLKFKPEMFANVEIKASSGERLAIPTEAVLDSGPRKIVYVEKKPGVYEASMHTTLRQLVFDYAGGMIDDRPLKAVIPGGSSVPLLLPDQLDTPAGFDSIQKAGSLLGSAGLIVMNDSVCMVWLAMNLLHFYRHESCGKCTPCREGTDWLFKLLGRLESGEGRPRDLDLLFSVSNNIAGKTLCAFGDAAATPVISTMTRFREEYEAHVREGRCPRPAPWRARRPVPAGAH